MGPPSESSVPARSSETSGLAVASLVTGILGVTCNAFVLPFIAIVCGHLAKKRIRAADGRLSGDAFALWGLVLGYIGAVISLIMVFALFLQIRLFKMYEEAILQEVIKDAPL